MRIKSILAVPAIVLAVSALAACGSTDSNSANPANAAPAKAAPVAAVTADYSPIPIEPGTTPEAERGLDFGILTSITTTNGVVTLHVDRTHFYQGAEAKAHNHGEMPIDDLIFDDTDGAKELTFTLDPKASLQGEAELSQNGEGNYKTRDTITMDHFIKTMTKIDTANAAADPDSRSYVRIWMRHTNGPDGPVTALADQWIN